MKLNYLLVSTLISSLSFSSLWAMGPTEGDEVLKHTKIKPSLEGLPKPLLGYIFSFLDDERELGRMALVSKKVKKVSELPNLWQRFGYDSHDEVRSPLFTITNTSGIDMPNFAYLSIVYKRPQNYDPENSIEIKDFKL